MMATVFTEPVLSSARITRPSADCKFGERRSVACPSPSNAALLKAAESSQPSRDNPKVRLRTLGYSFAPQQGNGLSTRHVIELDVGFTTKEAAEPDDDQEGTPAR